MLQGKVYETLEQTVTMKQYQVGDKLYWLISDVQGDIGYYTYEAVRK